MKAPPKIPPYQGGCRRQGGEQTLNIIKNATYLTAGQIKSGIWNLESETMSKLVLAINGLGNVITRIISRIYPLIIICILGIIIYSNSFDCSLHFDDFDSIRDNTAIRDARNVKAVWNFINRRFVTYYTFALNYHFHKLEVFGYHIVNVVIHIAASFMVWWLVMLTLSTPTMRKKDISKYKGLIALGCGLLFVSHPVQTQAVTYIVQRLASLSTLFYLASLCFYSKARQTKKKFAAILLFASLAVTALLGIFTKEIVITLPFSILLYEIYFLKAEDKSITTRLKNKKFWLFLIPFVLFILIIPYLLSFELSYLLSEVSSQRHLDPPLTTAVYFMTQFRVVATYIRLLFIPVNQNVDYDFPASQSFFELYTFLGFLFLAAIFFTAIRIFSRYRLASFGILWFFLTLSVEAIKPLGNVIFEHRLYLPMFGFSLFFVSMLFYILGSRYTKAIVIITIAVVCWNSCLTYRRNRVWKDDISLWSDVIQKSPNKARPYNNLGRAYHQKGNLIEAKKHYLTALRINPFYPEAYNNLGNVLSEEGKLDEAKEQYTRALQLNSIYTKALNNLGSVFFKEEKFDQAKKQYLEAIRFDPNQAESHNNLGLIFLQERNLNAAEKKFREALRINSNYTKAHINLGDTFFLRRNFDEAIREYSRALQIEPDIADAHKKLGRAYFLKGDIDSSAEHFKRALSLHSDYETHFFLSIILIEQKKIDEAFKHLLETVRLNPDHIEAHRELFEYYQSREKIKEAQAHFIEIERLTKQSMQKKGDK